MDNNTNRVNLRKYITIPDYKPLFAMAKDFGPTHGPLDRPTPTTVEIIGKLLQQDGRDALSIFEVKKLANGTFSKPVQLTRKNYMLPYDQIVAGQEMKEAEHKVVELGPGPKAIAPKIVTESKPEPKPVHKVRELSDTISPVETLNKNTGDVTVPTTPEEEPVPVETSGYVEFAPVEEETTPEEETAEEDLAAVEEATTAESDAPKKLTKAERKAQRRAEREKMGNSQ